MSYQLRSSSNSFHQCLFDEFPRRTFAPIQFTHAHRFRSEIPCSTRGGSLFFCWQWKCLTAPNARPKPRYNFQNPRRATSSRKTRSVMQIVEKLPQFFIELNSRYSKCSDCRISRTPVQRFLDRSLTYASRALDQRSEGRRLSAFHWLKRPCSPVVWVLHRRTLMCRSDDEHRVSPTSRLPRTWFPRRAEPHCLVPSIARI